MLARRERLDQVRVTTFREMAATDHDRLGELVSLFLGNFAGPLTMACNRREAGDPDGLLRAAAMNFERAGRNLRLFY